MSMGRSSSVILMCSFSFNEDADVNNLSKYL
jgi:hypothetical protein